MTVADSSDVASSHVPGPELPVHLTRFVGRDQELADLVQLASTARLLTLTGAGGSGKTRLAREALLRLGDRFDRIGWTDLAPLTGSHLVGQQAAAALDVRERADVPPRELIARAVGGSSVLLVLDNCEHLVDACAELADALLRACPRLVILATSREALGVASETAWLVPPLAGEEAVELFAERARAALPSFKLTPTNERAVREICRRLDGIPLAIELAAARVRVLSPLQIADRLGDAFHLLVGRSRTALPRHRTLRATMEWSHDLLAAREQVLLRRLAVFAGSFSLESAEAVCAGAPLEVDDILDGVATLVDKSLIMMEPGDGEARYRLLETVRQYAMERLEEAGEHEPVEVRFARHFLEMLEAAEPTLIGGSNAPEVLERVVADLDNLRAAATWSVSAPERVELGLRFVGAAFWLCYALGMFREMRQVTDQALALTESCTPRECGRAYVASGLTALAQGEYDRACSDFGSALPLVREAGDDQAAAITLAKHGAALMLKGDIEGAIALLDEAIELTEGWPEQDPAVVFARFWRSWAAHGAGDLDLAYDLMASNVRVGREHGLPTTTGHAIAALGRIQIARGRMDEARALASEALDIEVAIKDGWGIGLALDVVALTAARSGRREVAVKLLAGTEALRARISLALPGPTPLERVELLDALREQLGMRFEQLHAEGHALSTDETVRLARLELADLEASSDTDALDPADPSRMDTMEPHGPVRVRPTASGPRLTVHALGPLEVFVDGRPVEPSAWGSARPRELLVYLLMHPEGRTKEQVGLAFWPDASTAQLRNNFHVTLHRLRKALGAREWVIVVGERYRMDGDIVDFDAAVFERETATARRALKRQAEGAVSQLEAVLSRYRGDFLDGEPAGDWHLEPRDRLQRVYLDALMELGAHHTREERHERAAEVYRRVLARDDLHEEALRSLVRALAEAGERSQALRAYQRFEDRLRKDLGMTPENRTTLLMEQLVGLGREEVRI